MGLEKVLTFLVVILLCLKIASSDIHIRPLHLASKYGPPKPFYSKMLNHPASKLNYRSYDFHNRAKPRVAATQEKAHVIWSRLFSGLRTPVVQEPVPHVGRMIGVASGLRKRRFLLENSTSTGSPQLTTTLTHDFTSPLTNLSDNPEQRQPSLNNDHTNLDNSQSDESKSTFHSKSASSNLWHSKPVNDTKSGKESKISSFLQALLHPFKSLNKSAFLRRLFGVEGPAMYLVDSPFIMNDSPTESPDSTVESFSTTVAPGISQPIVKESTINSSGLPDNLRRKRAASLSTVSSPHSSQSLGSSTSVPLTSASSTTRRDSPVNNLFTTAGFRNASVTIAPSVSTAKSVGRIASFTSASATPITRSEGNDSTVTVSGTAISTTTTTSVTSQPTSKVATVTYTSTTTTSVRNASSINSAPAMASTSVLTENASQSGTLTAGTVSLLATTKSSGETTTVINNLTTTSTVKRNNSFTNAPASATASVPAGVTAQSGITAGVSTSATTKSISKTESTTTRIVNRNAPFTSVPSTPRPSFINESASTISAVVTTKSAFVNKVSDTATTHTVATKEFTTNAPVTVTAKSGSATTPDNSFSATTKSLSNATTRPDISNKSAATVPTVTTTKFGNATALPMSVFATTRTSAVTSGPGSTTTGTVSRNKSITSAPAEATTRSGLRNEVATTFPTITTTKSGNATTIQMSVSATTTTSAVNRVSGSTATGTVSKNASITSAPAEATIRSGLRNEAATTVPTITTIKSGNATTIQMSVSATTSAVNRVSGSTATGTVSKNASITSAPAEATIRSGLRNEAATTVPTITTIKSGNATTIQMSVSATTSAVNRVSGSTATGTVSKNASITSAPAEATTRSGLRNEAATTVPTITTTKSGNATTIQMSVSATTTTSAVNRVSGSTATGTVSKNASIISAPAEATTRSGLRNEAATTVPTITTTKSGNATTIQMSVSAATTTSAVNRVSGSTATGTVSKNASITSALPKATTTRPNFINGTASTTAPAVATPKSENASTVGISVSVTTISVGRASAVSSSSGITTATTGIVSSNVAITSTPPTATTGPIFRNVSLATIPAVTTIKSGSASTLGVYVSTTTNSINKVTSVNTRNAIVNATVTNTPVTPNTKSITGIPSNTNAYVSTPVRAVTGNVTPSSASVTASTKIFGGDFRDSTGMITAPGSTAHVSGSVTLAKTVTENVMITKSLALATTTTITGNAASTNAPLITSRGPNFSTVTTVRGPLENSSAGTFFSRNLSVTDVPFNNESETANSTVSRNSSQALGEFTKKVCHPNEVFCLEKWECVPNYNYYDLETGSWHDPTKCPGKEVVCEPNGMCRQLDCKNGEFRKHFCSISEVFCLAAGTCMKCLSAPENEYQTEFPEFPHTTESPVRKPDKTHICPSGEVYPLPVTAYCREDEDCPLSSKCCYVSERDKDKLPYCVWIAQNSSCPSFMHYCSETSKCLLPTQPCNNTCHPSWEFCPAFNQCVNAGTCQSLSLNYTQNTVEPFELPNMLYPDLKIKTPKAILEDEFSEFRVSSVFSIGGESDYVLSIKEKFLLKFMREHLQWDLNHVEYFDWMANFSAFMSVKGSAVEVVALNINSSVTNVVHDPASTFPCQNDAMLQILDKDNQTWRHYCGIAGLRLRLHYMVRLLCRPNFNGQVHLEVAPYVIDILGNKNYGQIRQVTLEVLPTNDPPLLRWERADIDSEIPYITAVPIDSENYLDQGTSVKDIVLAYFFEPDGEEIGMAVVSAQVSDLGFWQFSLSGKDWKNLTNIDSSCSVLKHLNISDTHQGAVLLDGLSLRSDQPGSYHRTRRDLVFVEGVSTVNSVSNGTLDHNHPLSTLSQGSFHAFYSKDFMALSDYRFGEEDSDETTDSYNASSFEDLILEVPWRKRRSYEWPPKTDCSIRPTAAPIALSESTTLISTAATTVKLSLTTVRNLGMTTAGLAPTPASIVLTKNPDSSDNLQVSSTISPFSSSQSNTMSTMPHSMPRSTRTSTKKHSDQGSAFLPSSTPLSKSSSPFSSTFLVSDVTIGLNSIRPELSSIKTTMSASGVGSSTVNSIANISEAINSNKPQPTASSTLISTRHPTVDSDSTQRSVSMATLTGSSITSNSDLTHLSDGTTLFVPTTLSHTGRAGDVSMQPTSYSNTNPSTKMPGTVQSTEQFTVYQTSTPKSHQNTNPSPERVITTDHSTTLKPTTLKPVENYEDREQAVSHILELNATVLFLPPTARLRFVHRNNSSTSTWWSILNAMYGSKLTFLGWDGTVKRSPGDTQNVTLQLCTVQNEHCSLNSSLSSHIVVVHHRPLDCNTQPSLISPRKQDECGICGGLGESCLDCNGDVSGVAVMDCDVCVGGMTGKAMNVGRECNGQCNKQRSAAVTIDECALWDKTSYKPCNPYLESSFVDECGVCQNDSSILTTTVASADSGLSCYGHCINLPDSNKLTEHYEFFNCDEKWKFGLMTEAIAFGPQPHLKWEQHQNFGSAVSIDLAAYQSSVFPVHIYGPSWSYKSSVYSSIYCDLLDSSSQHMSSMDTFLLDDHLRVDVPYVSPGDYRIDCRLMLPPNKHHVLAPVAKLSVVDSRQIWIEDWSPAVIKASENATITLNGENFVNSSDLSCFYMQHPSKFAQYLSRPRFVNDKQVICYISSGTFSEMTTIDIGVVVTSLTLQQYNQGNILMLPTATVEIGSDATVPHLLAATISNDWQYIVVQFSCHVHLKSCSTIFDDSRRLYRQNMMCSSKDNKIVLKTDIALEPLIGTELKVGALNSITCIGAASASTAVGQTVLTGPHESVDLNFRLIGPNQICGNTGTYRILSLSGIGKENIFITWRLHIRSNSSVTTQTDKLKELLEGLPSNTSEFTFPSQMLEPYLSYSLTVSVIRNLKQERAQTVNFTFMPENFVSLTITGPNKVHPQMDIYLMANVALCPAYTYDRSPQLSFYWEMDGSNLDLWNVRNPILTIEKGSLSGGRRYLIRCLVILDGDPSKNSMAEFVLETLLGNPIATVAVSRLTVPVHRRFQLNGELSYDPFLGSHHQLMYSWSCQTPSDSNCYSVSANTFQRLESLLHSSLHEPVLVVNASLLTVGEYIFKLTVQTTDGREASTTTHVTIIPKKQAPLISIARGSNSQILPTNKIPLRSFVTASAGTELYWQGIFTSECEYFDITSSKSHGWYRVLDSDVVDMPFSFTLDLQLLTSNSDGIVSHLLPNSCYKLRLTANHPLEGTTYGDIILRTTSLPKLNPIKVSPKAGVALFSKFSVDISGLLADDSSGIIHIGYILSNESTRIRYLHHYASSSFNLIDLRFPAAVVCNSGSTCLYRKSDVIEVLTPKLDSKEKLEEVVKTVSLILDNGNLISALSYAAVCIDTLKVAGITHGGTLQRIYHIAETIARRLMARINMRIDDGYSSRDEAFTAMDTAYSVFKNFHPGKHTLASMLMLQSKMMDCFVRRYAVLYNRPEDSDVEGAITVDSISTLSDLQMSTTLLASINATTAEKTTKYNNIQNFMTTSKSLTDVTLISAMKSSVASNPSTAIHYQTSPLYHDSSDVVGISMKPGAAPAKRSISASSLVKESLGESQTIENEQDLGQNLDDINGEKLSEKRKKHLHRVRRSQRKTNKPNKKRQQTINANNRRTSRASSSKSSQLAPTSRDSMKTKSQSQQLPQNMEQKENMLSLSITHRRRYRQYQRSVVNNYTTVGQTHQPSFNVSGSVTDSDAFSPIMVSEPAERLTSQQAETLLSITDLALVATNYSAILFKQLLDDLPDLWMAMCLGAMPNSDPVKAVSQQLSLQVNNLDFEKVWDQQQAYPFVEASSKNFVQFLSYFQFVVPNISLEMVNCVNHEADCGTVCLGSAHIKSEPFSVTLDPGKIPNSLRRGDVLTVWPILHFSNEELNLLDVISAINLNISVAKDDVTIAEIPYLKCAAWNSDGGYFDTGLCNTLGILENPKAVKVQCFCPPTRFYSLYLDQTQLPMKSAEEVTTSSTTVIPTRTRQTPSSISTLSTDSMLSTLWISNTTSSTVSMSTLSPSVGSTAGGSQQNARNNSYVPKWFHITFIIDRTYEQHVSHKDSFISLMIPQFATLLGVPNSTFSAVDVKPGSIVVSMTVTPDPDGSYGDGPALVNHIHDLIDDGKFCFLGEHNETLCAKRKSYTLQYTDVSIASDLSSMVGLVVGVVFGIVVLCVGLCIVRAICKSKRKRNAVKPSTESIPPWLTTYQEMHSAPTDVAVLEGTIDSRQQHHLKLITDQPSPHHLPKDFSDPSASQADVPQQSENAAQVPYLLPSQPDTSTLTPLEESTKALEQFNSPPTSTSSANTQVPSSELPTSAINVTPISQA